MADEHEGPRRAKPALPAMPPFRGPLGVPARSSQNNGATPDSRKAPPPFLGTRPAGGQTRATTDASLETASAPMTVESPMMEIAPPSESTSSATDLPWLDTSTDADTPPAREVIAASPEAIPFPPYEHAVPDDAAPAETAQALAGLPYFDGDGDQHERGDQTPIRASGKMHRIEFDLASVLERIADRVRTGSLVVPDVDPLAGEGAALAAVLAALLRHRG
jgi:hypothetical protein